MNDSRKNIVQSIRARLTNMARETGRPFYEVLQYYGIERFLYRLSLSKYADRFILKGGLVFYNWNIPLRRATKDVDFLGLVDNQIETIQHVIRTAISISAPEDGARFDPASIVVKEIQVDSERLGIRTKFLGYLGNAKMNMQIDIGFSDKLTVKPELINYPTLLSDLAGPQLIGYPVEAVIAEKFHAMERYAALPTRWKDYYDIWLIAKHFEIVDQSLREALAMTFDIRGTSIPIGRPNSLTIEFASKYRINWQAFLIKSGLENSEINDLPLLVDAIWEFIEWPLQGLTNPLYPQDHKHWFPREKKWK